MAANRALRVTGGVILGIVVVVFVALMALPSLVNVNQYHDKIQAEVQQKLGRPVTLGNMELKVFPVRVRVDNLSIGDDPNFGAGQPFATAKELDLSVKLLPLLRKNIELDSIELVNPRVELVRNAQGVWNYASLGGPPTTAAPKQPSGQELSISDLKLTDGTIAVTDGFHSPPSVTPGVRVAPVRNGAQPAATRAVYDHIDLDLKNFAPKKKFDFNLAAHLPGQGNQSIALDGSAGPINENNSAATPIDGKLTLNSVQIAALQDVLKSDALKDTAGVATGEVSLKNDNGNFAAEGKLKLDQGKMHGVELGYPLSANFDVKGEMISQQFQISKMDVKLGPTPVSVSGAINAKATPMIADVRVKASDANLTELARLASAFGVAFAPGTNVAGRLNADVTAKGAVNNPVLNGSVNLANVKVSGAGIKQPVSVPAIQIALTPTQMHANQFAVSTGGTNLNVAFTLDNYTEATKRTIDATLNTQQSSVEDLLDIAHAYGASAAEGITGSGQVALDAHVTGPLANTAALNFSGTGALRNASISLPSLTKPINVRNADLRFSQNTATLQNLNVNVASTNATGNLAVSNFASPHLQFALNADKVNVAELQALMKAAPSAAPRQAQRASLTLIPLAEAATQPKSSMIETLSGGGPVNIGQILYQGIVLNNTKANVMLDHGVVKLAPVTSDLFNGTENGTVTIDTRPTQPVVTVNSNLQKVDANKLLTATTSVKQIFGLLSAGGNFGFTNVANGNLASTLNGTLNMNLLNGKITGIDLLRELGNIAKFGGGGSGVTNITQMSGGFNVRNGLAHTDNLKAVIDGGTLAAVGDVNLASEQLNMKITAVLSNGMSQKVGGTGVGGYLNTALANRQGELVIPVLVTGTFSSPRFAPDVQQLAQMKLNNLLPTTGNPAGALSGILGGSGAKGGLGGVLGALGGQQQNQQNANQPRQQQSNPQDAIKGLLNQLGGKKQPK